MNDTLISVVLPFRDAAPTLAETLSSIAAQTHRNFELLAVDDHSADESATVARAFARQDPRVRLVETRGRGLVDALNTGVAEARGPWIARMDADDICHAERFARQLQLVESDGLDVVGCAVSPYPGDDVTDGMAHYLDWVNGLVEHEQIAREMWVESPMVHPTVTLRTDVLRDVGGYRDGDFPEDYDLWLRLLLAGARFGKVDDALFHWRDQPTRLTRVDSRYSTDAFRRLKVEHLAASLLSAGKCQIWGAGPDGKRWLPALEAKGVEVERFFDIDTRKIGGRVRSRVPVVSFRELDAHRGVPLLAAVGVKGARALIRAELSRLGWTEGLDWVAVQ